MDKSASEASARALQLRDTQQHRQHMKRRIKDVLNGGRDAITALFGSGIGEEDLPVANFIYSGITRLSQKLQRPPGLKIDLPPNRDSEAARKHAEKRERIVNAYDECSGLVEVLPDLSRHLPAYGAAALVLKEKRDPFGNPYPHVEMVDSFDLYTAPWGRSRQPDDIAIFRRVEARRLAKAYPHVAELVLPRSGGGVLLGGTATSTFGGNWEYGQSQAPAVEVCEYYDANGHWLLLPEKGVALEFTPNPLRSGPQFVALRRYAVDQLTGHYDHVLGLMSSIAKLNLLARIVMEDAAFAETVVEGNLAQGEEWRRGRDAINYLEPGSRAYRMQSNLPYQMFQETDRVERQLRLASGYSVQDDGQSPNSFVTGRGLDELKSGVDMEINEYQKVIGRALEMVDFKRLEWDEAVWGGRKRPLPGSPPDGKYAEEYTPTKDIAGNYKTRRVYGVMAGFDEPQKIVTGLQLVQGGIIDRQTLMEQLDGLEDITEIQKRMGNEQADQLLRMAMEARAQQGDPTVLQAIIEEMPQGKRRDLYERLFIPQEPSPEEQMQQDPLADLAAGSQTPPDVSQVLSRLTLGGQTQGGVQTVGRLA